jgi:hypothetical protein
MYCTEEARTVPGKGKEEGRLGIRPTDRLEVRVGRVWGRFDMSYCSEYVYTKYRSLSPAAVGRILQIRGLNQHKGECWLAWPVEMSGISLSNDSSSFIPHQGERRTSSF